MANFKETAPSYSEPSRPRDIVVNNNIQLPETRDLKAELDALAREQQLNSFCAVSRHDSYASCKANRDNYPLSAVLRGERDSLAAAITKQNESWYGPSMSMPGLSFEIVPAAVLARSDLSVTGGASLGGNVVGTKVSPTLVDFLYPATPLAKLATVLEGLSSNLTVVRDTGAATVTFIPENTAVTPTNPTFEVAGTLKPHRLSVEVIASNALLTQSAMSVDQLLINSLRRAVAVAFNTGALLGNAGTGVDQLTGLVDIAGLPTVTFGATATYAKLLNFEKTLDLANVEPDASSAWIVSATTKNKWSQTPKIAGFPNYLYSDNDRVIGFPAYATTLLESTNKAVFGRFSDLVIGTWGGLGILTDRYSLAEYNKTRYIVTLLMDCLVQRTESFCWSADSAAQ
jgi:HK97 family phage major capsid protein